MSEPVRPDRSRPGAAPRCRAALLAGAVGLAGPAQASDLAAVTARMARSERGHFVLIHDLGPAAATRRLDLADEVAAGFRRRFADLGFSVRPPDVPLVSVHFGDPAAYRAALDAEGASAFANTRGFYHPASNRVLTVAWDGPAPPGADPDDLVLAIAAHETVHQLMANSGLLGRSTDLPAWLHEGIATQFEVVRDGRWLGPLARNDLRLADYAAIGGRPRLVPLVRGDGFDRGYRREGYAAAWGLVHFLWIRHPDGFRTYLDLLIAPTVRETSEPARRLAAFRSAFGPDLAAIEAEWHAFMDEIRSVP